MTNPDKQLSWALVGAAAALAVIALWTQNVLLPFGTSVHGLTHNGRDFAVYRAGSVVATTGGALYAAPVRGVDWFTYPPFAALVFAPFGWFSPGFGQWLWLIGSLAALAWVFWRVLLLVGLAADRRLALTGGLLAITAVDLEPVRTTLWLGQINIFLMALVLLDLLRPDKSRFRGAGVGIAAGIKLTPLIFLPYLVITRQWRATAWATGAFAATVLGTWAVLPRDSTTFWLHAIRDTSHIATNPDHAANQSVKGFLIRLWFPDLPPGWLWLLLALASAAAGLVLAARAHQKHEELLALVLVGLTGCAASPFSWSHHWVWFGPLIIWLAGRATRAERPCARIGFWGAAAALSAWTFMWVWRPLPGPGEPPGIPGVFFHYLDRGHPWYIQIVSFWYLWAYLAILSGAVWSLRPAHAEKPA